MTVDSNVESRWPAPVRRSIAPDADAPATARAALGALRRHLEDDVWERSSLVITEVVTNSFKHAGLSGDQRIDVMIAMQPACLRVEVTDDGAGFEPPAVRPELRQRLGGWGLVLVDQLSDRWGVESGHSTRVWCEFELRKDASAAQAQPSEPD